MKFIGIIKEQTITIQYFAFDLGEKATVVGCVKYYGLVAFFHALYALGLLRVLLDAIFRKMSKNEMCKHPNDEQEPKFDTTKNWYHYYNLDLQDDEDETEDGCDEDEDDLVFGPSLKEYTVEELEAYRTIIIANSAFLKQHYRLYDSHLAAACIATAWHPLGE